MKLNIISCGKYLNDAKVLAERLGNIPVLTKLSKHTFTKEDIVINWGNFNSSFEDTGACFSKISNQPTLIRLLSLKHLKLSKLYKVASFIGPLTAQKMVTPRTLYFQSIVGIPQNKEIKATILNNGFINNKDKVWCHYQNRKLSSILESLDGLEENLIPAICYTKDIPCKREYRVYVCNNGSTLIFPKILKERFITVGGVIKQTTPSYTLNNTTISIPSSTTDALRTIAETTLSIFSLRHGAVDIIRTPEETFALVGVDAAPPLENEEITNFFLDYFIDMATHFCKEDGTYDTSWEVGHVS